MLWHSDEKKTCKTSYLGQVWVNPLCESSFLHRLLFICKGQKHNNHISEQLWFTLQYPVRYYAFLTSSFCITVIMTHLAIFLWLWGLYWILYIFITVSLHWKLERRYSPAQESWESTCGMSKNIRNMCQYFHYYIYTQHKQHKCRF